MVLVSIWSYIMKTKMKIEKCPCIECICLAICINRKEINCILLLKFLNKYNEKLYYPEWPNLLEHLRKILKGEWCVVGVNNLIYKVQKDRMVDSSW